MAAKYIRGLAAITDWYDGDTPHGVIDLGDGLGWGASVIVARPDPALKAQVIIRPQRFRIAGFLAPELKEQGGPEARDRASMLVPWGLYPILRYGLDKWRRPLVDIELPGGLLFSHVMLSEDRGRLVSIGEQLGRSQ